MLDKVLFKPLHIAKAGTVFLDIGTVYWNCILIRGVTGNKNENTDEVIIEKS